MREIQSSEAKTHLAQILDEVERGASVIITRHGRPIARIIPEQQQRRESIDQARSAIEAIRRANGAMSIDDILSSRHEGHRI